MTEGFVLPIRGRPAIAPSMRAGWRHVGALQRREAFGGLVTLPEERCNHVKQAQSHNSDTLTETERRTIFAHRTKI